MSVPIIVTAGLAMLLPGGVAHADTVRQGQWYLAELKIDQVHEITTGRGVTVGLIDTGVETSHPDLRGRISVGPRFDSSISSPSSTDTDGHGTAMAGIIAGKGGGENDALGIAPDAKVLSVQGAGEGRSNVANRAAIVWAVDHGVKVLNLSFASPRITDDMRQAVAYALRKDVVVVAGVGNTGSGQTEVGSPASIPGVIAVSGTSRGGGFWNGSTSGPQTVLSAPGDGIVSTASRAAGSKTGFGSGFGTSGSTAIVSGAAALVRAKYPNLKAPDVINRLIRTADDAGPAGRDPEYGFGRLDILRAVTADVPHVSANPLGASTTGGSATANPQAEDLATPSPLTGKAIGGFVILGLGCLAVIFVPIYLLVAARRRKRAQRAGPVGAQGNQPAGQYPPGAYPPGAFPPPGAYPQAGGYPPGPHPPAGGYPPETYAAGTQSPGAAYPPADGSPGGYPPGPPPAAPRNHGGDPR